MFHILYAQAVRLGSSQFICECVVKNEPFRLFFDVDTDEETKNRLEEVTGAPLRDLLSAPERTRARPSAARDDGAIYGRVFAGSMAGRDVVLGRKSDAREELSRRNQNAARART